LYVTGIKVDSLIERLEKYRIRVSKSEKKSKAFLVEFGIVTLKGN